MMNSIDKLLAKLGNKHAKERLKLHRASDLYAKALREFQKEAKYLEATDGRLTLPKAEYTAEDAENARRDLDEAFERGEITEEELTKALDEIDSALEESEGRAAAQRERNKKQHSVSEDGRLKLPKVEADQVMHTDTASYSISPTLESDLEKVLNNTFRSKNNEVYIGETSNFLTDVIGAKALRMTMPASKAYAAMVDEDRAIAETRWKEKHHYHNLGIKGLVKAIKASENPVAAFEGKDGETGELNGNIVLVTDMKHDGNFVVVVEALHTEGYLDKKFIKANKIVTSYDRETLAADILKAVREGRILYLNKKRSQPVLKRVPAAALQGSLKKVDFKKNIQNFWMDVKWIRSGNTQYSSGTSDDGDTAFAHAFKNPGKLRTKSNRSYSVSEETDGKLHLSKVEPVEETAQDTASGETDGRLRLPRVRQEEKQDNGVDFGEGVRYNEIKNEGGGNNGREMDHSGVRGRFEMANSGERTAEGAGSGRVFETGGAQTGFPLYSRRGGRYVHTQDSEGRRVRRTENRAYDRKICNDVHR